MGPETWIAIGKFVGAIFFGAGAGAGAAYVFAVNVARLAVLSLAAKLTAPKPDLSQIATEKLLTVRDSISPQKLVYGEDMVSGPLVFSNTAGTDNKELYMTVALTGHQIDGITEYRIDDATIPLTSIMGGGINGAVIAGKFNGVAEVEARVGNSTQTVYASLNTDFSLLWTAAHTGRGWSHMNWKFSIVKGSEDAFDSGIPRNLRALVRGKLCYDRRLDGTFPPSVGFHRLNDPTTWEWSDNPAVILSDFLRDSKFGLGEDDDRIDWEAVIIAANICDELVAIPTASTQKRYTCNATFISTEQRGQIRDTIVDSMLGRLVFSQGLWKMWAGAAVVPDVTLTEANLAGQIQLQASAGAKERYNRVRGKFIDASRDYVASSYPEQRSSVFVTEDGGEVRNVVADFTATNNSFEAQRKAIVTLKQSRNQRIVVFEGNFSTFRIQPGTTVLLSIAEYGFASDKFFVSEWTFNEKGVALTLVEEDDTVWADPAEVDYTSRAPSGVLNFGETGVSAPTALTAVGITDGIEISWTNPELGTYDHIEVWGSDDNDRNNASIIATVPGEFFFERIYDNFRDRYYWVRAVGPSGQFSNFEPNLTTTTATAHPIVGGNQLAIDPDFDLSTAQNLLDGLYWEGLVFDTGVITTPGSVVFNAAGGANGSNSIILNRGDTDTTASVDLRTIRRVRLNNTTFEFKIRYRTSASVNAFYVRASGFSAASGGAPVVGQSALANLPDTAGVWTDLVMQKRIPGADSAQYWRFTVGLFDLGGVPGSVEIDSAFIYPITDEFGVAMIGTAKNAGLVPSSALASNVGKFLKEDATWSLGKPGQKDSLFVFDTSTAAADPGAGGLRLNNVAMASVTNIYVDELDQEGISNAQVMSFLGDGMSLFIQSLDDPTKAGVYTVNGTPTDNGGWWTIPVNHVSSNLRPDNLDHIVLSIDFGAGGGAVVNNTPLKILGDSDLEDHNAVLEFWNASDNALQGQFGFLAATSSYSGCLTVYNRFHHTNDEPHFEILWEANGGSLEEAYEIRGDDHRWFTGSTNASEKLRLQGSTYLMYGVTSGNNGFGIGTLGGSAVADMTYGTTTSSFRLRNQDALGTLVLNQRHGNGQFDGVIVHGDAPTSGYAVRLQFSQSGFATAACLDTIRPNLGAVLINNLFSANGLDRALTELDRGMFTESWQYNTFVYVANAPTGFFRMNSLTLSAVTRFVCNDTPITGQDAGDFFFGDLVVGDIIYLKASEDNDKWASYTVDIITDLTGNWELDVTYIAGGGTAFASNDVIKMEYTKAASNIDPTGSLVVEGLWQDNKIWVASLNGTQHSFVNGDTSGSGFSMNPIGRLPFNSGSSNWAMQPEHGAGVFRENEELGYDFDNFYWFCKADFRITNGSAFGDYMEFSINPGGTEASINLASLAQLNFTGATSFYSFDNNVAVDGLLSITGGNALRILDSDASSFSDFDYDLLTNNFDFAFGNTTDVRFNGFTGDFIITGNAVVDGNLFVTGDNLFRVEGSTTGIYTEFDREVSQLLVTPSGAGNGFWLRTGTQFRIWDSTNTDYMQAAHDGTDFDFTFLNTGIVTFGAVSSFYNFLSNVDVTADLFITGGNQLQIFDASGVDSVQLLHNGTNAVFSTVNGDIHFAETVSLLDNLLQRVVLQDYAIESDTNVVAANAVTLTYSDANVHELDLEAATGTVAITISGGPPAGTYGEMTVKVQQDSTADRVLTWAGGTIIWAVDGLIVDPKTGSDAITIYHLQTWDGGTTWYISGVPYGV